MKNKKAFTLTELLITVIIMGILMTMGFIFKWEWINKNTTILKIKTFSWIVDVCNKYASWEKVQMKTYVVWKWGSETLINKLGIEEKPTMKFFINKLSFNTCEKYYLLNWLFFETSKDGDWNYVKWEFIYNSF